MHTDTPYHKRVRKWVHKHTSASAHHVWLVHAHMRTLMHLRVHTHTRTHPSGSLMAMHLLHVFPCPSRKGERNFYITLYKSTRMCVRARAHTHTHTLTCMHALTHARARTCTHTHTHTHSRACTRWLMHVRAHTHTLVRARNSCAHARTHTHARACTQTQ